MKTFDLTALNGTFERATPQSILTWAWEQFGPSIAATSSFQSQSLPLLHMIAFTVPELPVFFLDTGFHFPETLAFRDQLMAEFGLNVQTITPAMGHEAFRQQHGELYRSDPDLCCYINKVAPLQQVKAGLSAWVTGIRRDQTETRRNTAILTQDRSGQYKICPMATWTQADVWRYINRHNLPVHPLMDQGYRVSAAHLAPGRSIAMKMNGRDAGPIKTKRNADSIFRCHVNKSRSG